MSEDYEKYFACRKPGKKKKSSGSRKVTLKSSPLRRSAKRMTCSLRIPGICNRDDSTVCLDHVGVSGMGTKSIDGHAVYGCSSCHAFIDGGWKESRHKLGQWTKDKIIAMIFSALLESQLIMHERGLINLDVGEEDEA